MDCAGEFKGNNYIDTAQRVNNTINQEIKALSISILYNGLYYLGVARGAKQWIMMSLDETVYDGRLLTLEHVPVMYQ